MVFHNSSVVVGEWSRDCTPARVWAQTSVGACNLIRVYPHPRELIPSHLRERVGLGVGIIGWDVGLGGLVRVQWGDGEGEW